MFKMLSFSWKIGKCLVILAEMERVEDRFSNKNYCKNLAKLQSFRHSRRKMPDLTRDEMDLLNKTFYNEYGNLFDLLKQDCQN